MNSGPQRTLMAKGSSSIVRTDWTSSCGHASTGPSGVADQFLLRMRLANSPVPEKIDGGAFTLATVLDCDRLGRAPVSGTPRVLRLVGIGPLVRISVVSHVRRMLTVPAGAPQLPVLANTPVVLVTRSMKLRSDSYWLFHRVEEV